MLSALAAVTDRLGLAGTVNTTFNEPYELARRLSTLDHLSDGRAAWNVVTTSDAFTGENFRRGGYLDRADRYERAAEFVRLSRELWDSWRPDAVAADRETGTFVRPGAIGDVGHRGAHFSVEGRFTLPRSPQGHPVVIQAGGLGRGTRVRRRPRRRDLHPARQAGGRQALLRRRQAPPGQVRP
ncbi:LLM class flavin-dependent oxidoreductase [Nonomuraea ferruginea]